MRQPAKHNVGKSVDLILRGAIENRMIVAVDDAPPGGHAVDYDAAIG